jgi:glycosyltransferase involved in cell wall biosynthesis
MPTRNRRALVPFAIRFFEAQDYPDREMVIVDDGAVSVEDLIPKDPRYRYLRIPPTVLGEKRNVACQAARGDIIVNWDDDDWYAPNRITTQIGPILRREAPAVGLAMGHVLTFPSLQFWRTKRTFMHGPVAFLRSIWQQHGPYPSVGCGEDSQFVEKLRNSGVRIAVSPRDDLFVYLRHGSNTWKQFDGARFGWSPEGVPPFFPKDELTGYLALAGRGGAKTSTPRPAPQDPRGERRAAPDFAPPRAPGQYTGVMRRVLASQRRLHPR